MRRSIRTLLLIGLCGGMVFQSGCMTTLVPLLIELGGSLVLNTIMSAITEAISSGVQ